MRVFIGVPLESGVRRRLSGVMDELRLLAPGRYVPAENLHITLRFIGETKALGGLARALDAACLGFSRFNARLDGLGKFDRQGKALVFARVLDPERRLRALHESLETALGDAGFGSDGRTFKPHITLGREVALTRLPELPLGGTLSIGEVVLFESVRTESGMQYSPLHRVKL